MSILYSVFLLPSFFSSRIPSGVLGPHYILPSCLFRFFWVVIVSQTFLGFSEFKGVLVRYFAECLNWDLSDVFLMVRLELWVLVRKITEVKVPLSSYHITSRVHTINMTSLLMLTLITWLR